ncbi:hypothetical protein [Niabella aquatica]
MKTVKQFLVVGIGCILAGCAIQRTSKFTIDTIKPGMRQDTITSIVGKPYKQTFYYGTDSSLYEAYYYKEAIWKNNWFEVNNVLHFKNGQLVSLEQGREKHLYGEDNKN